MLLYIFQTTNLQRLTGSRETQTTNFESQLDMHIFLMIFIAKQEQA